MKRGEIWWADLPDPIASEPGYSRPLVIIQIDDFSFELKRGECLGLMGCNGASKTTQ